MVIEKADITKLLETGIKLPEPFVAKGRDGVTDIWGVIVRPVNFDPAKKYPVIENIYAGPHGSFVPKNFKPVASGMHQLAELGFIVVQIDGMGTSNRSKAFHDVCWKNLKDAGFPDRILWIEAAAKKYPYMDINRVGIYGTSAGGQNAAGAVLFHPEFYKIAVASCGCHDNRMDKMWWNEQWMGWPVGEEYAQSSNVENAWRLKGKLLLMNGEMDNNVDPTSTMQMVNALIKANREFEYVFLPGVKHSNGGVYGERKRRDFFVKYLLDVNPPDWNMVEK
jgi:dipeptidyl aminopeptidase/acylaminoacyl peptidase